MPGQSRERRQAFARYNSSREPLVVPHGLSVRLGCRAHQEHLLVLAVQTLSGKTRQEKSHHRGGAYHHRHWLSLAEEPEQLRGSWRKLLRSHPLRRSQAVLGEAAPTTRAQGNSRTDASCLTHPFPQLFSREKEHEGERLAYPFLCLDARRVFGRRPRACASEWRADHNR